MASSPRASIASSRRSRFKSSLAAACFIRPPLWRPSFAPEVCPGNVYLLGLFGQRDLGLLQLPFQDRNGLCRPAFLAIVLRDRRLGVILVARRILHVTAIEDGKLGTVGGVAALCVGRGRERELQRQ